MIIEIDNVVLRFVSHELFTTYIREHKCGKDISILAFMSVAGLRERPLPCLHVNIQCMYVVRLVYL